MLYDPERHEALQELAWDEALVRQTIADIVAQTEDSFVPPKGWPLHPLDADPTDEVGKPVPALYHGACGVFWALHYLQDVGAVRLRRSYFEHAAALQQQHRDWLGEGAEREKASFLMGQTPVLLWQYGAAPDAVTAQGLAELIAGNIDHPARELMWGAPGTLLAALFLHERDGQKRWADLFRATAARLWSQLEWSDEFGCHYWTQDLYGQRSSYLDAVHGFVATALPLIRGRALLGSADWAAWQQCIEGTVQRTATCEGTQANWRPRLTPPSTRPMLMQFCHGAPGFVICLADMPGPALDPLLTAAGEAIWAAGPLTKGSNLCHGTGGNGYAFLKLHQRRGEGLSGPWLQRARAFAMHAIGQMQAHAQEHGQLRPSLWSGDPGLAIYLWDCLRGRAAFPTLDVFYGASA